MCKEKTHFLHWEVGRNQQIVLAEIKVGKERRIQCEALSGACPLRFHAQIDMDGICRTTSSA